MASEKCGRWRRIHTELLRISNEAQRREEGERERESERARDRETPRRTHTHTGLGLPDIASLNQNVGSLPVVLELVKATGVAQHSVESLREARVPPHTGLSHKTLFMD